MAKYSRIQKLRWIQNPRFPKHSWKKSWIDLPRALDLECWNPGARRLSSVAPKRVESPWLQDARFDLKSWALVDIGSRAIEVNRSRIHFNRLGFRILYGAILNPRSWVPTDSSSFLPEFQNSRLLDPQMLLLSKTWSSGNLELWSSADVEIWSCGVQKTWAAWILELTGVGIG